MENKKMYLFLENINKNQKQLIAATAQVVKEQPAFCLLCAGAGDQEQALRQQIDELGLQDHVKLLGYRTDVEQFVKVSDMIASVSYREGLPVNIMCLLTSLVFKPSSALRFCT